MDTYCVGEARACHRAKRRRLLKRIAEVILRGKAGKRIYESIVDFLMNINALDAATALSGIIERAIDQLFDREVNVRVGPDISWILSAQLQTECREGTRRRPLDRTATGHRPREVDVIDGAGGDQSFGSSVVQRERREQIPGQSDPVHHGLEPLTRKQCLCRVFEDDPVTRQKRRNNGVDSREIGIIPWSDHQHDSNRNTLDHTPKAGSRGGYQRRQGVVAQLNQSTNTLLQTPQFATVTHGPPHLHGEFRNDLVVLRLHGGEKGEYFRLSLGKWHFAPFSLSLPCGSKNGGNFIIRRDRTTRDFAAINRRDAHNIGHDYSTRSRGEGRRLQMISKYRASSQSVIALRNSRSSQ